MTICLYINIYYSIHFCYYYYYKKEKKEEYLMWKDKYIYQLLEVVFFDTNASFIN